MRTNRHLDTRLGNVRTRLIASAVALLMVATLAGCGTSAPATTSTTTTTVAEPLGLAGTWVRTGGNYSVLQGMVVEVGDDLTEGVVVSVPRNPYRFREGDVKWSGFTDVSEGRIRMRDLSRQADTGVPSYVTGVISVIDDGMILEITFPSTGTLQVWSRTP